MNTPAKKPGKFAPSLRKLLTPIMIFAVVAAPLCWAGAWFFSDRRDFSDALIGLGCLPIVVAVCAYLYLLVNRVERS